MAYTQMENLIISILGKIGIDTEEKYSISNGDKWPILYTNFLIIFLSDI